MKKVSFILAFMAGIFIFAGCNGDTDSPGDTGQPPASLTFEERKDIFASYFNHSTDHRATEVRQALDKMEALEVLTLDEALDTFWSVSGYSSEDYLPKTNSEGKVYYSHKTEDNQIAVLVNLLGDYTRTGETQPDIARRYGFIVVQTKGQDVFIDVSGEIIHLQQNKAAEC